MLSLSTILAAIEVIDTSLPEVQALIAELKAAFGATDQAAIDAAMNSANAAADAQHLRAQSLG